MKPGDVVLISLPQIAGGIPKLRPALILTLLPGAFQNLLICGISTQLGNLEPDWDELVAVADVDFNASGLHRTSAVRLSYLYAADPREICGIVGQIADDRLKRLRERFAAHLTS
jgi:mRNA interferase MazF